jgi:hypothetical protein
VLVLKGNGDGTFELTTPIASGLGAGGITVADFDGDARLDLAFSIAHLQPCPRCLPEQGWIALLRGRGDGTFEPPTLFSDVLHPFSLVTGDFNGDLRMDFAALNAQYYGSIQFLSVFLNNGDGTFRSVNMPSAWRLVGLAAGDFDSDRRTDLAVKVASAGYYPYMTYRNALAIILSLGDGAFRMSHSFPTIGSEDFTIPVAADFDGDLDLDLAITLPSAGVVGVWSGNGDGTFDPAALLFNVGALSRSAIAADFNGDSKPDLVTDGRKEHPDGNAPAIRLLTNTTPWLNSVEP